LTGEPDGGTAQNTCPEAFTAGDRLRVGLCGSPSRADGQGCTTLPEAAPGYGDNQLGGFNSSEHDERVRIVSIHEPSAAVMDRITVDRSGEDRRYSGEKRTFLRDGSRPSLDCSDFEL